MYIDCIRCKQIMLQYVKCDIEQGITVNPCQRRSQAQKSENQNKAPMLVKDPC